MSDFNCNTPERKTLRTKFKQNVNCMFGCKHACDKDNLMRFYEEINQESRQACLKISEVCVCNNLLKWCDEE